MVRVIISSQSHKEILASFEKQQDAARFCNEHDYQYEDENGFIWDMEIEKV